MSGAAPVLRPMRRQDLPEVLVLERDLFPEDAWNAETYLRELAAANCHYLVAQEATGDDGPADGPAGGRIVGFGGLLVGGVEGDIQTLGVDRAHWGSGIGGALLAALLDAAVHRGCTQVFLEVRADNPRAQQLYLRFGFVPIGLRRAYYQPAGVDAVVMRWQEVTSLRVTPVPPADGPGEGSREGDAGG
jgi:ribosomal-protein-alanine N-acetyltransferase